MNPADEVEAVLREHDLVLDARAGTYDSASGRLCLAAYVVIDPGGAVAEPVGLLTNHLANNVPSGRLPNRILVVDELPARPLPRPGVGRPELGRRFEPPATMLEALVAGVWAHVLDLDEVGRDDEFQELGGDSRAALEIWLLLAESLGLAQDDDLILSMFMYGDTVARTAGAAVQRGVPVLGGGS